MACAVALGCAMTIGLAAPAAVAKPIAVSSAKCVTTLALDCVVDGNNDGPAMGVTFNTPAHNDKQDNVQLVLGFLGITDTLIGDGAGNGFYKTDGGGNTDFSHDANGSSQLDWAY